MIKFFSKLASIIDSSNLFFFKLANWLCLILVLLTAEQVIARYFFNSSSVGLQELEWHLFGFVFLLAAAHALKANEHVRVDIFYSKCSPRRKALIDLIGTCFFLIPISAVIIYFGYKYAAQAFTYTNPNPLDFYTARFFEAGGTFYNLFASVEGFLRQTILVGEISPDPGGLEARWIIKALIPFGFLLVLLQGLSEIVKTIQIVISNSRVELQSNSTRGERTV